MGGITFNVGEVFPGDDPVARWVAGLIMISNDLARPHRKLYQGMQPPEAGAKERHVYWIMLGASHLREAVKFLHPDTCELMGTPEVEEFISGLPHETKALLDEIVGEVQPWEESWLFKLAKPLRDRLFHYTGEAPDGTDYTEEIGRALDAMEVFERELDFGGRNIDWHWGFGEEIRLNWVARGADLSLSDYGHLIEASNELSGRIVKFSGQAIRVYLEDRLAEQTEERRP